MSERGIGFLTSGSQRTAVGIERSLPHEPEDDDAARVRMVENAHLRLVMRALQKVVMTSCTDRMFRRTVCDPARDVSTMSGRQRARVKSLAWRYRRQMPRHLTPKFNPDDPVVREAQLG